MKRCVACIMTAVSIASCSSTYSTDYSRIRSGWQEAMNSGRVAAKDRAWVTHDGTSGRFYLHGERLLYVPKSASMTEEQTEIRNGNLGIIASEFLCSYIQIGKIGISVLSRPDPKRDSSFASLLIMDRNDSARVWSFGVIAASRTSQVAPAINPTGRLPIEQDAAVQPPPAPTQK